MDVPRCYLNVCIPNPKAHHRDIQYGKTAIVRNIIYIMRFADQSYASVGRGPLLFLLLFTARIRGTRVYIFCEKNPMYNIRVYYSHTLHVLYIPRKYILCSYNDIEKKKMTSI